MKSKGHYVIHASCCCKLHNDTHNNFIDSLPSISVDSAGQRTLDQDQGQDNIITPARRRVRQLRYDSEEEGEDNGGRGGAPTQPEIDSPSCWVVAEETVGGASSASSPAGGDDIVSPPATQQEEQDVVTPGQATLTSVPAHDPSITHEAPIPSGPIAAPPATVPPPGTRTEELGVVPAHDTPHPSCATQTPPCTVTPGSASKGLVEASDVEGNVSSRILLRICDELRQIREAHTQGFHQLNASITALGAGLLSVLERLTPPPPVVVSPGVSSLHVAPDTLPTPHFDQTCGVSSPVLASDEESTGVVDLDIVVMTDEDGE